jgi:hypothetical protein
MISIIICSVHPSLFILIEENISKTIGTPPFEIIKIDNTNNQYGICTAYNTGAAAAKFPYLCFVHEDVIFRSMNWGEELISFFEKNQETGLIGIAGSKYKSLSPGSWVNGLPSLDCLNLIQHGKNATVHMLKLKQLTEYFYLQPARFGQKCLSIIKRLKVFIVMTLIFPFRSEENIKYMSPMRYYLNIYQRVL